MDVTESPFMEICTCSVFRAYSELVALQVIGVATAFETRTCSLKLCCMDGGPSDCHSWPRMDQTCVGPNTVSVVFAHHAGVPKDSTPPSYTDNTP